MQKEKVIGNFTVIGKYPPDIEILWKDYIISAYFSRHPETLKQPGFSGCFIPLILKLMIKAVDKNECITSAIAILFDVSSRGINKLISEKKDAGASITSIFRALKDHDSLEKKSHRASEQNRSGIKKMQEVI